MICSLTIPPYVTYHTTLNTLLQLIYVKGTDYK